MTPVSIGISFGALYAPTQEVVRLGVEAEAGGFDDLWVPDSQMLYRDPYATLALLARATSRVRLGTLATNALTRHPAVTANAVLTVDELSGGRAVLGLATGDSAVRRIGARPLGVADLEAAVDELRTLLAGGTIATGGDGFAIRWAGRPAPPVYVVASGLRLLEVAGRVADGIVLNVGRHPAVLRAALERIRAGARAAGRRPEALDLVAFFFCLVEPDRARARARLKPSVVWFAEHFPALLELAGLPPGPVESEAVRHFQADYARYDLVHAGDWARATALAAFLPDAHVDAFALGGTAADVVEALGAVATLGLSRIVIRPPSSEDWVRTMRAVRDGVIPALR